MTVTLPSSDRPVHVSLLGCGIVGGGVLRLLQENAAALTARVGAPLVVRKVLVRDLKKSRVESCNPAWLTTNPDDVLDDPETDVVVEVLGGEEPAGSYVQRALDRRIAVVSANKLLLAKRGADLVNRASELNVDLAFEASVGGGIPVIRTLREALTGDTVESLMGIVNGTCNYILSSMRRSPLAFESVLRDAQEKGYAEADPSLDVDGHDAAQKLVVLAMLAFGAQVDLREVPTEGIRHLDPHDHRFCERFGYTIKHLAIGRDHGTSVELRVHPALVANSSVLANVSGALNAVHIDGRALGPCLLSGRGAGALPTAVSVVADLVEVARARREGAQGFATRGIRLRSRPILPLDEVRSRFYLRFGVADRPGVLASLAGALGDQQVSIEQMFQEGRGGAVTSGVEQPVEVVMLTHTARWGNVRRALEVISDHGFIARPPRALPVAIKPEAT